MNVNGYVCYVADKKGFVTDWQFFANQGEIIHLLIPNEEMEKVDWLETSATDMPRLAGEFGYQCVIKEFVTEIPGMIGN